MGNISAPIVISLGGSILVPDKVDAKFAARFKECIVSQIGQGKRFIIAVGGGRTARDYIAAAAEDVEVNDEDKDWLGIHATRLNAHFLRTLFREYAHSRICTNPRDLEEMYSFPESVLIAAGWRPGFSTDYVATVLATEFHAETLINFSNIDYVCDKDPRKFPDVKTYERMAWPEFRAIVGDEWSPGLSAPFDPVAAKLAEEQRLRVIIMNGADIDNAERFFASEKFKGTLIE